MATDTLDKVLKQRFEVWLRKRNVDVDCRFYQTLSVFYNKLTTIAALSADQLAALKKDYEAESFPGLEVSMEDITSMMTAPDPGSAVGAKAISAAAAGAVSKLRGGCARGWTSSTTKSWLPDTFCYKLLEDKMDFRTAKFSCQKQRSILLEFDTRAEVDDLIRIIADEHLEVAEMEDIWLGVKKKGEGNTFVFQYNSINATSMLGLSSEETTSQECAVFE